MAEDPHPWVGTSARNLCVTVEDGWGTEHLWFGPSFTGRVDAETRALVMAHPNGAAVTWSYDPRPEGCR